MYTIESIKTCSGSDQGLVGRLVGPVEWMQTPERAPLLARPAKAVTGYYPVQAKWNRVSHYS